LASVYGYITVSDLEKYASIDYSAVSSQFTDDVIEAQISNAERQVNVYCNKENEGFSDPIPDSVVSVCLELSRRYMSNLLTREGFGNPNRLFDLEEVSIWKDDGLKKMLGKHVSSDVGIFKTVPMYYDGLLDW